MKKLLILLSGLLAASALNEAYAQNVQFGVRAGYNLSGIGGQDLATQYQAPPPDNPGARPYRFLFQNLDQGNLTYTSGFHVGGYVTYPTSERFALEAGLYLSTRGYRYTYVDSVLATPPPEAGQQQFTAVRISEEYSAYHLDVPILARIYLYRGFNLLVGPQASFRLANTFTREAAGGTPAFTRTADDFRRFDLAIKLGLGYELDNGLNLNLAYDSGLLALDNRLSLFNYHRVLQISVGYTFGGKPTRADPQETQ